MYMYTRTIEKKERFCSNLISILKKKVVEKRKTKFTLSHYHYEKYHKFVNRGYDIIFSDNSHAE